jgi:hypothetical protein
MIDRPKAARAAVIAAVLAALLAFTAVAVANNLDRRTATNAAKSVGKRECRATTGCTGYAVRELHRLSRHKWLGKLYVFSVKNGERFECTRQIVVKLDHVSGKIYYATSKRRCDNLGPA